LSNSIPANNVKELIEYTKAHPDEVNYGYLGIGSFQNMLAKKLEKLTGMKMTGIPYRGAAEALQEIVGGRNHLYIGPPLSVMPLYSSKQVKVIATTGAERLTSAPEIPTLKESGVPLVTFAWLGVCARSGTPQSIVDLLNGKVVAIVNSPEYRSLVEQSGSVAISSTPQEFQKVINETVEEVAPIVQEFSLQLD
jgi:tripartite-type tricarboxylate transporter receptor subunit TctC